MKSRTLQAVLIPAASLLAGCVETVNIDEGNSLVLDATRRVILVKSNPDGAQPVPMAEADAPVQATSALGLSAAGRAQGLVSGEQQFEQVGSHTKRLVCAEPSPDALSALAASGEVSIGINGQGGSGGGGVNEAAAIAARTGAMQILRDLGYRACEGLMNGVIGASGYNRIIGGTASTVLGLVAVEGLTGGRFAETTTISAEAPAITPHAGFGQGGSAAEGAGQTGSGATPAALGVTANRARGVGGGEMAEDQGSADEPVPVNPAVRPPYITEHAADAVVKVVCLASAGTSRDRRMRQEMFELCLDIPGHGEATAARTGAAAAASRQNPSRAAVEALSR